MTSSNNIIVKAPSSKLINLIAEANFTIESAKEKILTAYNYAIEIDKFTPQQAHNILRERLFFSKRYIREVLPLEAKESKFANKPKEEDEEEAERVPPSTMSELEKFRQQKGKQVPTTTGSEEEEEKDDLSSKIPDERLPEGIIVGSETDVAEEDRFPEPHVSYEIQRHQEVIKHLNERIEYLGSKFEVNVSIDFEDKILPIIIIANPENKSIRWRPDQDEINRLQKEEHKKMVIE